jgi:hypothetical protein
VVPVGELDPNAFFEASFTALFLFFYQALNGVALRALSRLRPALTVDEAEYEALRHDLVRAPGMAALLAIPLGAIVAILSIQANPLGYSLPPGAGPSAVIFEYTSQAFSNAIGLAFAVHTIHQLRVVTRIHASKVRIDIFRLDPLYEFANLTAWTGIAIFGTIIYGVGSLALVSGVQFSPVDIAQFVAFAGLAVGCFFVPLLGLHGRIVEEKARRRSEAGGVLEAAVAEVETRIRAADYEGMSQVNDGLAAATSAVTTISRVSTWPWRPDTIRGFASAIALPIVIYVITALISRFIS